MTNALPSHSILIVPAFRRSQEKGYGNFAAWITRLHSCRAIRYVSLLSFVADKIALQAEFSGAELHADKFKVPIHFFFRLCLQQRGKAGGGGEKMVWLIYFVDGLRREEERLALNLQGVDFDLSGFPSKEGKKQAGAAKGVIGKEIAWGIPPYLFVSYLIVSFFVSFHQIVLR